MGKKTCSESVPAALWSRGAAGGPSNLRQSALPADGRGSSDDILGAIAYDDSRTVHSHRGRCHPHQNPPRGHGSLRRHHRWSYQEDLCASTDSRDVHR